MTRPPRRVVLGFALGVVALTATRIGAASRDVLLPVADTALFAGKSAKLEHGGCRELEVDRSPIALSYLEFEVTSVRSRVTRATLTLHALDSSPDGGTVYEVRDSSWSEGTHCGKKGTGLRHAQVDCDGDGAIDAGDAVCSSYVPDFARPVATLGAVRSGRDVTVDVTSAFQSGNGFYTLALANDSRNGAEYASREHKAAAWRPRLTIEMLGNDECDTPTVIAATPFLDTIDTRSAGTSDGDPAQSCVFPTGLPNSVWYGYTAPADGVVTVSTAGSGYPAVVSVHTGTCNPIDNMLSEAACAGEVGGTVPAATTFAAVRGTTYLILVTDGSGGFGPGGGTLRLALDFAPL